MYRPRVIPVLLLRHKGLVKTVNFKKPRYIGDPINSVKIFNDLEADELVFLDITATLENRTISHDLVKNIGDEAYMPFTVGGGIKSIENIRMLLHAGAEKVILNSVAAYNIDFVNKAAETFGNSTIIVSIDVKKDRSGKELVFSHSGRKNTGMEPVGYAQKIEKAGAGEIIINSILHEGRMNGYNLDLIRRISDAVNVPVVALGGAGNNEDLKKAVQIGHASAAAAGSLFVYHGQRRAVLVNYPEKIDLFKLFQD